MKRPVRILTALAAAFFYLAPAVAGGLLGDGRSLGQSSDGDVVARGSVASLSADAMEAYYEALVFCLQQIGQPAQFSAAEKRQMQQLLIQGFPDLPAESQTGLANARATWTQYRDAWPQLGIEQKKAFAFDVLSLAYGDAAAAQALGMNSPSQGGHAGGGYPGYTPSMTEDYSRAYGGGISAGDGTYEVETFDSSTGSYGYSYE